MTKLTLNRTAIEQLAGNAKVRVRAKDGVLQMRPTHRVSGKRLPKGEVLVDVNRMGIFSQVKLSAFDVVDMNVAIPAVGVLSPAKHGWLALVEATDKGTVKSV